jgi:hypothetical protein
MTPKERATRFHGQYLQIGKWSIPPLTKLIVDAENDALERAALIAVDLTDPMMTSERIRALKHQDNE